jgi:hypothetical protein
MQQKMECEPTSIAAHPDGTSPSLVRASETPTGSRGGLGSAARFRLSFSWTFRIDRCPASRAKGAGINGNRPQCRSLSDKKTVSDE